MKPRHLFPLLLLVLVAAEGCLAAEAPKLTDKSDVDAVLDALHDRGVGLKSFTADVALTTTDLGMDNSTSRAGKVCYQSKGDGDARLRVAFDTKTSGGKTWQEKLQYLLDKGSLLERNFNTKTEVKRQVAKTGEKLNLLKLGEGPFPLPIGQDKADVQKLFDAEKVAAAKDDPPATVHIVLKPKPKTQFANRFTSIDVWVDTNTNMPTRISTRDPGEKFEHVTDLTHIKVTGDKVNGDATQIKANGDLTDKDFDLDPKGPGWAEREEGFQQ